MFHKMCIAAAFACATVFTLNATAKLVAKDLDYSMAGKKYQGFIAYDDSAKSSQPGVLVTHDWMGLSDRTKDVAKRLAAMGYVAFAVDVYGVNERPKDQKDAARIASFYKKDRTALRARMQQGLRVLREQAGVDKSRVAAIGYCFGGTSALELGRAGAELKAIVSFHGGLDSPKPDDGKKIQAKVLILHGADDPFNPAADVAAFQDEMRKAGVDWQMISYGGAIHSFTDKSAGTDNSKGAAYNESADRRSWAAMSTFFKEAL